MRNYDGIWAKRQMLSIWILQSIALGVFAGASCVLLVGAHYIDNRDFDYYYGYSREDLVHYAQITGAVILAMCAVTFTFVIVEMILYKRRTLSPTILLVFAVLKTAGWGAYFVLCVMAAAAGSFGWLDTLLSLVLFATALTQLVQSARLTHMMRKGRLPAARGQYQPTTGGAGGLEAGHAAPAPVYNNNNGLHPTYYYGGPPVDTAYRSQSPAPAYHAGAYGTEMETRKVGQH